LSESEESQVTLEMKIQYIVSTHTNPTNGRARYLTWPKDQSTT